MPDQTIPLEEVEQPKQFEEFYFEKHYREWKSLTVPTEVLQRNFPQQNWSTQVHGNPRLPPTVNTAPCMAVPGTHRLQVLRIRGHQVRVLTIWGKREEDAITSVPAANSPSKGTGVGYSQSPHCQDVCRMRSTLARPLRKQEPGALRFA